MPGKKKMRTRRAKLDSTQPTTAVNLKDLAETLGLSSTTVSLVLNHSPIANSIPARTKRRIFSLAKKLHYHPNFVARSLRAKRSYTIGVMVPEVSEGYEAMVLSGIEDFLLQEGYFYFVVSHRHRRDLIEEYPHLLLARSIEGLIAVDTPCGRNLPVPVVAVSGHREVERVTNIVLDHDKAAALAVGHLFDLGHRKIALIKGQSFSSDTEVRWASLRLAMSARGLPLETLLTAQLEGDTPSPQLGYLATKKILAAGLSFTALIAFNDVSAIGAIRALREAGFRVPEDVSVVGFDDIQSAAFQNPALTTIRQPLWEMGQLAAETVLRRIAKGASAPYSRTLMVEPKLVVRESTAPAPRELPTVSERPSAALVGNG